MPYLALVSIQGSCGYRLLFTKLADELVQPSYTNDGTEQYGRNSVYHARNQNQSENLPKFHKLTLFLQLNSWSYTNYKTFVETRLQ